MTKYRKHIDKRYEAWCSGDTPPAAAAPPVYTAVDKAALSPVGVYDAAGRRIRRRKITAAHKPAVYTPAPYTPVAGWNHADIVAAHAAAHTAILYAGAIRRAAAADNTRERITLEYRASAAGGGAAAIAAATDHNGHISAAAVYDIGRQYRISRVYTHILTAAGRGIVSHIHMRPAGIVPAGGAVINGVTIVGDRPPAAAVAAAPRPPQPAVWIRTDHDGRPIPPLLAAAL